MRRKTMLAWLALLGLSPSVALAQQTMYPGGGARFAAPSEMAVPAGPSADWISLKDDTSAHVANHAAAVASPAACVGCDTGCVSCEPCFDPCATGVRRWTDPNLRGAWINVDYLLWRVSGYNVPPLVSDAPNGEIPVLGANPNARVLLGNEELDDDFRSGMRIRFGDWLDDTQSFGVEGHFFFLGEERNFYDFVADGDGARSLGRPFFNVDPTIPGTPGEAVLIIGLDNAGAGANTVQYGGRVDVDTSSNVYSAGVLARHFLAEDRGMRVDVLGGYRFFRLDEGLLVQGTTIAGPANNDGLPVGFTFRETDIFDTSNEFHGGEFGLAVERDFGDFLSVEVIGKVAMGNVHQEIRMEGTNTLTFPGLPPVVNPGGLLAQPTNTGNLMGRGSFEDDDFAILPEVNLNVGMQLTRNVRATAGWSVMYLDNAVRPGDQIDRVVNGSQLRGGGLVGPARPAFGFDQSDMWLYGVSFGMEATY